MHTRTSACKEYPRVKWVRGRGIGRDRREGGEERGGNFGGGGGVFYVRII